MVTWAQGASWWDGRANPRPTCLWCLGQGTAAMATGAPSMPSDRRRALERNQHARSARAPWRASIDDLVARLPQQQREDSLALLDDLSGRLHAEPYVADAIALSQLARFERYGRAVDSSGAVAPD